MRKVVCAKKLTHANLNEITTNCAYLKIHLNHYFGSDIQSIY